MDTNTVQTVIVDNGGRRLTRYRRFLSYLPQKYDRRMNQKRRSGFDRRKISEGRNGLKRRKSDLNF